MNLEKQFSKFMISFSCLLLYLSPNKLMESRDWTVFYSLLYP